jgi:hypothetical protein
MEKFKQNKPSEEFLHFINKHIVGRLEGFKVQKIRWYDLNRPIKDINISIVIEVPRILMYDHFFEIISIDLNEKKVLLNADLNRYCFDDWYEEFLHYYRNKTLQSLEIHEKVFQFPN